MAELRAAADLPQDVVMVKDILESMGVTEYEPRVLMQLLDFTYRYTAEILQDADAVSERANNGTRGEVTLPDVMLAVQSRAQHSFVQPPSQQMLARIAEQYNRRPLPELRSDRHGLRLPPDVDCLLAPNYQLQPRTPEGLPPVQQQAQQAAQQAAAGAPGLRRDHRIEIRAPQSLPQPQQPGDEQQQATQQWQQQGQAGQPQQQVPGAVAGGQADDIDMMFEDI